MAARTRIKVCCIASVEEVCLAVDHGADALGFVGPMPNGVGVMENDLIAELVPSVPPAVASFLLTSETEPDAIIEHARHCRANTVQIVDHIDPSHYEMLRAGLPGIRIVQVIHVEGPDSIKLAKTMGNVADGILLDSGTPSGTVKKLGGTGRTHDWSLSRGIVQTTSCPVFLAGGLHPENVGEAIHAVRPYGVDVCTGLRKGQTKGNQLDPVKLNSFVNAVARADAALTD